VKVAEHVADADLVVPSCSDQRIVAMVRLACALVCPHARGIGGSGGTRALYRDESGPIGCAANAAENVKMTSRVADEAAAKRSVYLRNTKNTLGVRSLSRNSSPYVLANCSPIHL
jgi:hypothetical protein